MDHQLNIISSAIKKLNLSVSHSQIQFCIEVTADKHQITTKEVLDRLLFVIEEKKDYIPLSRDTQINILLQLDEETLKQYCLVDKITTEICNTKYFWEKKFYTDNLPFVIKTNPKTAKEWVDAYKATKFLKSRSVYLGDDREEVIDSIFDNFYESDNLDVIGAYITLDPSLVNDPIILDNVITGYAVMPKILDMLLKNGLNSNEEPYKNIPLLLQVLDYVNNDLEDDFRDNQFSDADEIKTYKQYDKIIGLLLKHGSNPNYIRRDQEQNSLLHEVIKGESIRFLRLFLKAGADPNKKNVEGMTPFLSYCKYKYSRPGISFEHQKREINLFRKYKTDFKAKDKKGNDCNHYSYAIYSSIFRLR